MRKLIYATGNEGKFTEASLIFEGWQLERRDLEIVEIQGNREEIILHKALEASKILKVPCIVEDVSLECEALGGFPGPYAKCFIKQLGVDQFYNILEALGNRTVKAICTAAYVQPGKAPLIFEGSLEGTVVAPLGNLHVGKYSFNSVFLPKGCAQRLAEMSREEMSRMSMRSIALNALKRHLENEVLR